MQAELQQTVRYNHYSVPRSGYYLDVYAEEGYGSRLQSAPMSRETLYRGFIYRCNDDTRMYTTERYITEIDAIEACLLWIRIAGEANSQ